MKKDEGYHGSKQLFDDLITSEERVRISDLNRYEHLLLLRKQMEFFFDFKNSIEKKEKKELNLMKY